MATYSFSRLVSFCLTNMVLHRDLHDHDWQCPSSVAPPCSIFRPVPAVPRSEAFTSSSSCKSSCAWATTPPGTRFRSSTCTCIGCAPHARVQSHITQSHARGRGKACVVYLNHHHVACRVGRQARQSCFEGILALHAMLVTAGLWAAVCGPDGVWPCRGVWPRELRVEGLRRPKMLW